MATLAHKDMARMTQVFQRLGDASLAEATNALGVLRTQWQRLSVKAVDFHLARTGQDDSFTTNGLRHEIEQLKRQVRSWEADFDKQTAELKQLKSLNDTLRAERTRAQSEITRLKKDSNGTLAVRVKTLEAEVQQWERKYMEEKYKAEKYKADADILAAHVAPHPAQVSAAPIEDIPMIEVSEPPEAVPVQDIPVVEISESPEAAVEETITDAAPDTASVEADPEPVVPQPKKRGRKPNAEKKAASPGRRGSWTKEQYSRVLNFYKEGKTAAEVVDLTGFTLGQVDSFKMHRLNETLLGPVTVQERGSMSVEELWKIGWDLASDRPRWRAFVENRFGLKRKSMGFRAPDTFLTEDQRNELRQDWFNLKV